MLKNHTHAPNFHKISRQFSADENKSLCFVCALMADAYQPEVEDTKKLRMVNVTQKIRICAKISLTMMVFRGSRPHFF